MGDSQKKRARVLIIHISWRGSEATIWEQGGLIPFWEAKACQLRKWLCEQSRSLLRTAPGGQGWGGLAHPGPRPPTEPRKHRRPLFLSPSCGAIPPSCFLNTPGSQLRGKTGRLAPDPCVVQLPPGQPSPAEGPVWLEKELADLQPGLTHSCGQMASRPLP